MRKLAVILFALGLLAAVLGVVSGGVAASFDDTRPCPAQGPLLVCPAGTVGVPYSVQLAGHDGCERYWWRIDSGALPPGLTLSSSGLVSGTPTEPSTATPWVSIHDLLPSQGGYDWCGGDNQSERQFQFTVGAASSTPPVTSLKWYWHLTAGTKLLHSERAVTYPDGSNGLGKMLAWEQNHKDAIRAAGRVALTHLQATG